MMPCLEAVYGEVLGKPTNPQVEDMLTMRPQPAKHINKQKQLNESLTVGVPGCLSYKFSYYSCPTHTQALNI
jgi:hypothetical protein